MGCGGKADFSYCKHCWAMKIDAQVKAKTEEGEDNFLADYHKGNKVYKFLKENLNVE